MSLGRLLHDGQAAATRTRWNNNHPEAYHKGTYSETILPVACNAFYDDFWTRLDFWVAADNSAGYWTKELLDVATIAHLAEACGWCRCSLTNAHETQHAVLDCGAICTYELDYGLQFEARVRAHVLPTGTSEIYVGMGETFNPGTIGAGSPAATYALFTMVAGGAVSIYTNDGVTVTGPIATGYTQVADDIGTVRIDITNPANVKFYINGTRICRATTFNLSAVAATWQPMLGPWKDDDASLGVLDIDYVRIWQERY
jgi:hypothetical protein